MSDTRPTHPADRLLAAIEKKRSPVCVGIDPVMGMTPRNLHSVEDRADGNPEVILTFCAKILEAIAPHVPCVKPQSACFERFHHRGSMMLWAMIHHAKQLGLEVVLDAKRGDIGTSAEHYADAYLTPSSMGYPDPPDWLTINSYLGEDGITPFLKHEGHGAFALVRTSNPGGDAIQNLELKDGRTVSHAVAEIVADVGSKHVGERGYSSLGAVVGATKKQDAAKLREIMPHQMFLVPGYGAQGAGVDDILPCFKSDGTGAIVTASRSVIYAFDRNDPKWTNSVADAAAKFADEIGRAVGMR